MATYGVTGSASGLGAAVRRRLEADGHDVVGVDLRDAEVVADLSGPDGRASAVERLLERGPYAGFVACAGVSHDHPNERIVEVNYFGAVELLAGVRPEIESGGAAVVFSSNSIGLAVIDDDTCVDAMLAGDRAAAHEALADQVPPVAYAMSKRALAAWVRSQVGAWAEAGVRINAVAPGAIETPLLDASRADPDFGPFIDALPIPLGRTGQPDEIAEVVLFLLGPGASYVHGSIVFCDGGIDAEARVRHV